MNARIVGIDVAKDTLSCWSQGRAVEIANRRTEIRRFLKGPPPDSVVGVEVTSSYHRTAVDLAFETGFEVYALNPVDCARYRQALHGRGKTDEIDARLIARFVERERDSLRRYAPLPENVRRLKDLLSRRETMVKARAMMGQSLEGVPDLAKPAKGALEGVDRLIRSLGEAISSLTDEMEGKDLLPSVPAVGPLGAAQALSVPTTGGFKSADAFVAYAGLDCRPQDSGPRVGRRVLSKRGNRYSRKLLFLSALCACRTTAWKPYYQRQLAKGLAKTQALVVLARKIARTVWSVYTHRAPFDPARLYSQKPTAP
ncbi:MAG: IS110 family transposase [Fimbriimonadaceae bacterium]|nr:IS110 family transposase [Fimbriimonadaceae bacterium]